MKKTLLLIPILLLVMVVRAAATPITFVQQTPGGNINNGIVIMPNLTVQAGDLLTIQCVLSANQNTITSVTDHQGDSFALASAYPISPTHPVPTSCQYASGGTEMEIWYAANAIGGPTQVAVAHGNAQVTNCTLQEWSGASTNQATILDATSLCDQGLSNQAMTNAVFPTLANDLFVGGDGQQQNQIVELPPAGWTTLTSVTNLWSMLPAYDVQVPPCGGVGCGMSMSWVTNVSAPWAGYVAAFKAAAPAPTLTPVQTPTPSPTPTNSPTVSITASPTPTPSPVPTPGIVCPQSPGGPPMVGITGNVASLGLGPATNQRVQYQWGSIQNPGVSIIPGGSSCSTTTDQFGNLPAPPAPCTCFPQNAFAFVTAGSGQPKKIQFPMQNQALLNGIIQSQAAADPVVSEIDICSNPTDVSLTVTNPPIGTIGPATLCPSAVTGLEGIPICSNPSPSGFLELNSAGTQWCTGQTPTPGGNNFGVLNPVDFGAKFDPVSFSPLTINNGSPNVTGTGFTPDLTGKTIIIWDPPSGSTSRRYFTGTFTYVSATAGTLSGNYGGPNTTTAMAYIGTDDGAAINATFTSIPVGGGAIVQIPDKSFITSTTLLMQYRSIDFTGASLAAPPNTSTGQSSMLIWAGGNSAAIDLDSCVGCKVHDFAILGSDLTANQPTYGVELSQSTNFKNSFNQVYNVVIGDVSTGSKFPVPGTGNGRSTIGVGVGSGSVGAQDDRNIFSNVTVQHALYGYQCGQPQAVEWSFNQFHCNSDAICIDNHVGCQVKIDNLESLSDGLIIWSGESGSTYVNNLDNEDGQQLPFAIPWPASQELPRDFVIEDTSSHFQQVTVPGLTGATIPTFNISGGTTTDNQVTWQDLGTSGNPLMLALFSLATNPGPPVSVGGSGGLLTLENSRYFLSSFIPTDLDIIAADNGPFSFVAHNLVFNKSSGHPSSPNYQINLSVNGNANRHFNCDDCEGLSAGNFTTTVTNGNSSQVTDVSVKRHYANAQDNGSSTQPSEMVNVIVNGSDTLDNTRIDVGKLKAVGGPVVIKMAPAPMAQSATPAVAGAATYCYVMTSVTGTGESASGNEVCATSAAATVSGTNFITGLYQPVFGPDHYNVYRTVANGASGSEHFAFQLDPYAWSSFLSTGNQFQDTVPDGSLGAATPPTMNTTGFGKVAGVFNVMGDPLTFGDLGGFGKTVGEVLSSALPSYTQAISQAGTAAAWIRMGNASGNLTDSSGNSNTCVVTGGIVYGAISGVGAITDDPNTAVTWNGSTGACTIATSGTMVTGDTISMFIWVYPTAYPAPGGSALLAAQGTSGGGLFLIPGGQFLWDSVGVGAIADSVSTAVLPLNQWSLVGATKAGAVNHLYLGTGGMFADVTGPVTNHTLAPANGAVTIAGSTGVFFTGSTQDFVEYPTAVSATNAAYLYTEGQRKKYGVVFYATDVGCFEAYTGTWVPLTCGVHAVAGLPTCNASTKYGRAWVSDNSAACGSTGFWVAPTGSGSTVCPVACDGSGWKID